MLKTTLIILISLIIGFIIGVAATIFVYPFIFPPPQVNEMVQNVNLKNKVFTGQFIDPNPSDRVHWGRGNMTIYEYKGQYEVYLNKNFQVGPGPAFHVYVSQSASIQSNRQFKKAVSFDLGKLKSFKGSQIYIIPQTINMKKIKSVVIWCQAFKQLITYANLQSTKNVKKNQDE